MTAETSSGDGKTFDADAQDQETQKSYYHVFDDVTVEKMKNYFNIDQTEYQVFLRYLKNNKVPGTTPNDV